MVGSSQSAVSRRKVWLLGWNAGSPELSFPPATATHTFPESGCVVNLCLQFRWGGTEPPDNTQLFCSITGNKCCFKPYFRVICYCSIIEPILTDSTLGIVYQTFNTCCVLQILFLSPTALSFFHFSFREESIYFPKETLYLDIKTFFSFWQCHRKKIFPGKLVLFLYKFQDSEQRNRVSKRDQSTLCECSLATLPDPDYLIG